MAQASACAISVSTHKLKKRRARGRRAKTPGQKSARQRELTTKLRGELAELEFLLKATHLGFIVAKPYGDSRRYDFIVDSGKFRWRVQVKCSTSLLNGLYRFNAHRRTTRGVVPYDPSEVDFMAAYVMPENAWFIIPITVACLRTSLLICPRHWPRDDRRYSHYREAWHLLRQEDGISF